MRLILLSILGILLGIGYYLFVKPSDYVVVFTVRESAEVVSQHAYYWNNWNRKFIGNRISVIDAKKNDRFTMRIEIPDTTLRLFWRFSGINDSLTRIMVGAADPDRRLFNRLTAPFKATTFRNSIISNMLAFSESAHNLAARHSYNFVGNDSLQKIPVVYVPFRSTARRKSGEMIGNVIELNQYVKENNLGLDGHPFIIASYNGGFQDSIDFEFCFPVARIDSLPEHPSIRFRFIEAASTLKADYYGNYALSDMAWYRLIATANERKIPHSGQIREIFFNDPHSGGNDLEWKAEVHLILR